ncbi:nuclear transport factor 2 family protein [Thermobifida halotolerans]|uniref:Nuclear transport factor 2 family protein n=1 Tax=Thermobifida halotolerans TaxID=483545 RepID=A0A399G3M2_9ACTN|nr:nuclear transport factor 2 family protein [Thermobifida halotolerans]
MEAAVTLQEEISRAIESRDVDAILARFDNDADYVLIDQTRPPSEPLALHGRDAIGRSLRDIFAQDMRHEVQQFVVQGDHAAYVERCTYPDDSKVMVMSMLDLRSGRIVRQSSVQAWDESGTATPPRTQKRTFADADEVRTFEKGRVELLRMNGNDVSRAVFEPGWRWSQHVKPIAGTDLCTYTHFCYILSGTLGIRMADGSEFEAAQGETIRIAPGHDAWVVGEQTVVLLDWETSGDYAKDRD